MHAMSRNSYSIVCLKRAQTNKKMNCTGYLVYPKYIHIFSN